MEKVCSDLGLSLTAAFTIFAKKVAREKRIPFEISANPFYSENNIRYLEQVIKDIKEGRAKLSEHDLVEEE
jgi:DNA-damage-inducible protein J